jgi:formate-dependent nitrite reductase cytochrome c552 subunit
MLSITFKKWSRFSMRSTLLCNQGHQAVYFQINANSIQTIWQKIINSCIEKYNIEKFEYLLPMNTDLMYNCNL